MISLSKFIARLVVRRPWILIVAGVAIIAACFTILFSRQSFDTDILNLLPADRPAVKGLKIANERFTQARELTFVIKGDDADDVEDFQSFLVERLRQQPWTVRLLDGAPMETPQGHADLQKLIAPLLRNLPPDQFQSALRLLDPTAITERVSRLRRQLDAGSPAARLELENDPLGLLAAAAKPLWQSSALSDSFDLVSPDGKLRLIPVVTNQPTLSADDCRALMKTVHAFMEQTQREFDAASSRRSTAKEEAPTLEVTGRSAYVDEIATSMQRDIMLTSLVSLLTVTALFWLSFRRLLPLLGVALILAASALVSLTLGSLLFYQLNVIAIGFCSILFGLGDDFGLLLYEGYRHNRHAGATHESAIADSIRAMLPGILWVTLTTAIGFLALTLSGSAGFAQLGAMVAIGVAICAACVAAFLFLFVRGNAHATTSPSGISFHGGAILRIAIPVFLALGVFAALPVRTLQFDTSPHSLEPKNIPAAKALDDLMRALPDSFEPSVVILETRDPKVSAKLDEHLRTLVTRGILEEFSSPAALLLSVNNSHTETRAAAEAFRTALVENELNPGAFQGTFETLETLSTPAGTADWDKILPPESPWWFIVDRMIAPDGSAVAAFLKPAAPYRNAASAGIIEKAVQECGLPVLVTGWTQTLGTLVPWAKQELLVFGGGVTGVILLVLAFVYRDWRDWLAHTLGLLLAAGATVATLKLTGAKINLLNVLAFPLMLAVGVDYGMHLVLAVRDGHVSTVLKPVVISGLTTVTGFASLMLAKNPSLNGLGTVCALGVGWSLISALTIVLPLTMTLHRLRADGSGDKVPA